MNALTDKIIGGAIKVHRALGPGLLESAYRVCLDFELRDMGLIVEQEKPLCVIYRDVTLDAGYRIDLLVEECIIIETKSVDAIHPIHKAQLLSYLRLSNLRVGLLLNFNVEALTNGGIKRVLNGFGPNS